MYEKESFRECPFCGGSELRLVRIPTIYHDSGDFKLLNSFVSCLICGAEGPKSIYVDDVGKAWNERK
jgi:Lar family restriction alleviation protein